MSDAFADVLEVFSEATAAQIERMEERMLAKAKASALVAVTSSLSIAAATVAWVCANFALGLWVASVQGVITAMVIATFIHAAAALVFLYRAARASQELT